MYFRVKIHGFYQIGLGLKKICALGKGHAYIIIEALPGFPWVADLLMSFPEGTNEGYGPIFSDSRADRALVC